ncbi:MAG: MFS transporter [Chloroflexota bacterium]
MASQESLWRNPSFSRLWIAQIVSNAGSQITRVALPLTAVLTINATPAQMGMIGTASSLPNLLFSLFVGVWVDRSQRRPLLIAADLGRALLLGSIPIAVFIGQLTFIHLLVVAFGMATLGILSTIASVSILPTIVSDDQLVEANGKLSSSSSFLQIAGPSLAGGLVQLVTAPIAIIGDAISYFLSAFLLRGMITDEAMPKAAQARRNMWQEIGEGIHELFRTPVLQALTISSAVGALGNAVYRTMFILFVTRDLGMSPLLIGIVYTCGGVGALLGALIVEPTTRVMGVGRAIVLGNFLWAAGMIVIPLAIFVAGIMIPVTAPISSMLGISEAFLIVCVGEAISSIGATIYSVAQMSLRQHITPTHLFGRSTAARRFFVLGLSTGGAALGGVLGTVIGVQPTLLIGALGMGAGFIVVLFSAVIHVKSLKTE